MCESFGMVVLQGITSTVGAIPGVLGVALVGYLFDETKSWNVRPCPVYLRNVLQALCFQSQIDCQRSNL